MPNCTICHGSSEAQDLGGYTAFFCQRCGSWTVIGNYQQGVLLQHLTGKLGRWGDPQAMHRRSHLSYWISRQQTKTGTVVNVPLEIIENLRLDDPLPSPSEQLNELILFVGDKQPFSGSWMDLELDRASGRIGCAINQNRFEGINWILKESRDIFENSQTTSPAGTRRLRLSFAGWERHDALRRAKTDSRTAFMAMKFNDPELDRVIDECFRPAVKRAGFILRVLTDIQPAGSIDDQMRVVLRTSRFVIADLTHGNQGAYWEAGFGEGLGRPVIYSCKKQVWDEPTTKPHFDTNHLLTIIWELTALKTAEDRLAATIRVTLPGEAKMVD
jgi:hypothetical protein